MYQIWYSMDSITNLTNIDGMIGGVQPPSSSNERDKIEYKRNHKQKRRLVASQ